VSREVSSAAQKDDLLQFFEKQVSKLVYEISCVNQVIKSPTGVMSAETKKKYVSQYVSSFLTLSSSKTSSYKQQTTNRTSQLYIYISFYLFSHSFIIKS
jgi:hypothetical protein